MKNSREKSIMLRLFVDEVRAACGLRANVRMSAVSSVKGCVGESRRLSSSLQDCLPGRGFLAVTVVARFAALAVAERDGSEERKSQSLRRLRRR